MTDVITGPAIATDPRDERINGLVDALREIISLADDAAMHNSRDALRLIVGVCGRALGVLGGGQGGEERVGAAMTEIAPMAPLERRVAILEARIRYALDLTRVGMWGAAVFELDRALNDPDFV